MISWINFIFFVTLCSGALLMAVGVNIAYVIRKERKDFYIGHMIIVMGILLFGFALALQTE
ncbi:hypothetical protein [Paenibacillus chitinolyticus]|uniref:hypothetical protein n=1 Tax=Paenibacillus chitinolyticus TaxID=79263 RepID=UPI0035D84ED6